AARLLSIPTSFIKSTIERFQSSFSGLFAAKLFSTAATSTADAGATPEDLVDTVPNPACPPPAAGLEPAGAGVVAAGSPPKILDISLLNNPIHSFRVAIHNSSSNRSAFGEKSINHE